jgi:GNAT superfamily N-acetyltransferase
MTVRNRPSSQSFSIRNSTDEDLAAIKVWLSKESMSDETHSFIGNWEIIEKYHRSGSLLVCLEPIQKQPIAFQANATVNPEILVVQKEWRRLGIGESLVNHYIKKVLPKKQPILIVRCCPLTSMPFWKKMGFKVWTAQNGFTYGRLLIEPLRSLPKTRPTIRVRIKASPQYSSYGDYETIVRRKAAILESGSIRLEKRVALFDPRHPNYETPFLEIFAGMKMIFKGKATSSQAIQLGVERCENGFFIDKLHPKKVNQ